MTAGTHTQHRLVIGRLRIECLSAVGEINVVVVQEQLGAHESARGPMQAQAHQAAGGRVRRQWRKSKAVTFEILAGETEAPLALVERAGTGKVGLDSHDRKVQPPKLNGRHSLILMSLVDVLARKTR